MSKVILKAALATAIALQAGCAPLYKGLWLDKVFDEPASAFAGPTSSSVRGMPVQPTPVPQAPVVTSRAVSSTTVASTPTRAPVLLPTKQAEDKSDRRPAPIDTRTALGPSSNGPGSGPSQVALGGGLSPSKSLISSGSGSGPSQAARNPSRTNRR